MGQGEEQTYEERRYHIEVEHNPGTFASDMDVLVIDARQAYERLLVLKEKYAGHNIQITEIREITKRKPLSEGDLERMAKSG